MKTLLVAAVLAVSATAASTAELPRQFQGHWCLVFDSDEGMKKVSRPCKENDALTIAGNRVVYYNLDDEPNHCTVEAVANFKQKDKSFPLSYLVRLSCKDDKEMNGTYWFEITNGRLRYETSERSL